MNPGIFHSCRLDEVIHALGNMQQRTGCQRWMLAGYSLGGNFALRVARHGPEKGLSIGHALAVCPVINPEHVLKAMETGPKFYERYYLDKWAKSVRAKQASYPERYNYEEWYDLSSLRARTEFFATRYYDFESLDAYLEGYSIAGEGLQGLSVDSTLLTSEDDPVCPVSDLDALGDISALDVQVTRYGGHCGYLKNWKLYSWADDMITQLFLQAAAPVENTVSE
jgi:predicted alpha/beta-fold hydrolase